MMKHFRSSGQKAPRILLSFLLIVLPLWNLAGGFISVVRQQEPITETADMVVPDTVQPLETLLPTIEQVNETATLIVESPVPTEISPTASATAELATEIPFNDQALESGFISGEVLARFRNRASNESIEQCVESINASIISNIEELNAFVLSVPVGKVSQSISTLEACPDLRYVEPNYPVQIADVIPSDPGWVSQYGLISIRAPQGWEMNTGSSSVTIAVLDTGVDFTHPDLAGKLVGGIDIVNADNDPQDDNGHGTHVAGIAAASSNNGTGIAGVSWGARLMPVKVLNRYGNGSFASLADGIVWAVDHGAQIINLSLGSNNESQLVRDAVDYASARGVLLVAATGNTGSNFILYPARHPSVIAVAATDGANARAGISNYGPEADLAAPGISIYSTLPGGYGYRNGTSMAAPFVSGLAAILLGIPGNGSAAAVAQQMKSTALDLGSPGWDEFYGHGLIQMDTAINTVLNKPVSTQPVLTSPTSILPRLATVGLSTIVTPSLTYTTLPSSTNATTESPTLMSTGTVPAGTIESPEVFALGTPASIPVEKDRDWMFLCSGIILILLGIFLFWLAKRDHRFHRKIKRFR